MLSAGNKAWPNKSRKISYGHKKKHYFEFQQIDMYPLYWLSSKGGTYHIQSSAFVIIYQQQRVYIRSSEYYFL